MRPVVARVGDILARHLARGHPQTAARAPPDRPHRDVADRDQVAWSGLNQVRGRHQVVARHRPDRDLVPRPENGCHRRARHRTAGGQHPQGDAERVRLSSGYWPAYPASPAEVGLRESRVQNDIGEDREPRSSLSFSADIHTGRRRDRRGAQLTADTPAGPQSAARTRFRPSIRVGSASWATPGLEGWSAAKPASRRGERTIGAAVRRESTISSPFDSPPARVPRSGAAGSAPTSGMCLRSGVSLRLRIREGMNFENVDAVASQRFAAARSWAAVAFAMRCWMVLYV